MTVCLIFYDMYRCDKNGDGILSEEEVKQVCIFSIEGKR